MTLDKHLDIAIKAAKESGEYLKARKDVRIESEEGRDLKLSSDKASENIIIGILKETGIPILSEETGRIGVSSEGGLLWIADPLDGTVNYARGLNGLCCVSIALWKGNEPLIGVVNRFDCGGVYHGVAGDCAYLNGAPVKPSYISAVEKAVLATGFPVKFDYSDENMTAYMRNARMFKKVRMLGSAALMCALAATGGVDAYFEDNIMLWDIAGAVAIARANGCGIALDMVSGDVCRLKCFANPQLMEDYNAKTV